MDQAEGSTWASKIAIRFGLQDCRHCPARAFCTRSARAPRILAVRHQAEYETLRQARSLQQTEEFRQLYAQRSGIEGTHSQAVRTLGLRRHAIEACPKRPCSMC